MKKHALPLVDPGPADLAVVYVLREPAYDVVINADHLLTWGIDAQTLRDDGDGATSAPGPRPRPGPTSSPATATCSRPTPATAATPRGSCCPRSASTSPASAAARRASSSRCPIATCSIAGSLQPGDDEFADQFAAFVAELADGAHEPIERGLFELVGDEHELVPFAG